MATLHEPFFLNCAFRENRTYVHSTSLCNELTERFGHYETFNLVLKGWMTNRVRFAPVDAPRPKSGTGHVTITQDGQTYTWEMSEDIDFPVSKRDRYDEASLANVEDFIGEQIRSHPAPDATVFDRLIAANKVLITAKLNPGVKLIAAKVSLKKSLPNDALFDLELASHMGTRIFKSNILSDGSVCGELVFYGE